MRVRTLWQGARRGEESRAKLNEVCTKMVINFVRHTSIQQANSPPPYVLVQRRVLGQICAIDDRSTRLHARRR